MKEKSTDKFNAINKEAIVGTRSKIIMINPPAPKPGDVRKVNVSIKPAKLKRKKCSGCSRKRRSG